MSMSVINSSLIKMSEISDIDEYESSTEFDHLIHVDVRDQLQLDFILLEEGEYFIE